MDKIIIALMCRYEPLLKVNAFGSGEISNIHLLKMCKLLRENVSIWPIDKSNRWLGYIQGVMTTFELLNVNEEREFTRPLFHSYYKENKEQIPITIELNKDTPD